MLNIKKIASILPVLAIVVAVGVTSTAIPSSVEASSRSQTLVKSGACNTNTFRLLKPKKVIKTSKRKRAVASYTKARKVNPNKTCTVLKKSGNKFLVTKSISLRK